MAIWLREHGRPNGDNVNRVRFSMTIWRLEAPACARSGSMLESSSRLNIGITVRWLSGTFKCWRYRSQTRRLGFKFLVTACTLIGIVISMPLGANAQTDSNDIVVVDLDGQINHVTSRFLSRTLNNAIREEAGLVVIRLDTPGGMLDATREMVQQIITSPIPVSVYVAPEGAHAASAGTFLVAAASVAAMAPATNIGAASVVGAQGEDLGRTIERKANEDAAAELRSIAQLRGRNEDALAATVFDAKSYSAREAVDIGIVDLLAFDLHHLLDLMDGRSLPIYKGTRMVVTDDVPVRVVAPNLIEHVLGFLANPNVAFLLISIGGTAIIIELWHPGAWVPGLLGVVLLLFGFAGMGQLPFSWVGVALIGLSLVLISIEAWTPGLGLFGTAGVLGVVVGGFVLMGFFGTPDIPGPNVQVSRWLLIAVGIFLVPPMLWFAREVRRSRSESVYLSASSRDELVGQRAKVTRCLNPIGEVHLAGEFWQARLLAHSVVEEGSFVVVRDVAGLLLEVELEDTVPPG